MLSNTHILGICISLTSLAVLIVFVTLEIRRSRKRRRRNAEVYEFRHKGIQTNQSIQRSASKDK